MSGPRTIVGLSGGVDSAVAALLLLESGCSVEAVFMKNWVETEDDICPSAEDLADAQAVCDRLGITLTAVNFAPEYWERVFAHFLAEYGAGRTPNPDVLCNTEIKFRTFLDYALGLGAGTIATGHYARIGRRDGRATLLRSVDRTKDQSYFLHGLTQEQLQHARFPVGELTKPRVREIAASAGLAVHAKRDSTGICFIGERRFDEFIARFIPRKSGEIVTPEGDIIGSHHGVAFYTIGQRQGLGIGGRHDSSGRAWYVAAKDLAANRLTVVQGGDHPLLMSECLSAERIGWIGGIAPVLPLRCEAQVRYRQPPQICTVTQEGDERIMVRFQTPQRAVTPGQYVVFYTGEECLGGGVITSALR